MTSFTTKVVATGLAGALLLAASGAEAATLHYRNHVPAHHRIAFALQKAPRFSDTATLPGQCRPGDYWDTQKYSTDTPEMDSIPMACHGFGF